MRELCRLIDFRHRNRTYYCARNRWTFPWSITFLVSWLLLGTNRCCYHHHMGAVSCVPKSCKALGQEGHPEAKSCLDCGFIACCRLWRETQKGKTNTLLTIKSWKYHPHYTIAPLSTQRWGIFEDRLRRTVQIIRNFWVVQLSKR